ncbi:MAG TPA: hypothetical protein VKA51_01285, partial [Rubrobacteraceae bacterium]|nr:hypothetical protein [Rubrobacteraceae bacterium]
MFEGRAAIGYDHGYDAGVFYLGLVLDGRYVEGCPEEDRRGRRSGRGGSSEGRMGGGRRPGVRPGGAQGRGGRQGGEALNALDRAVFAAYGWCRRGS